MHPNFHILIWFMVADSKGFVVHDSHIRFFLQIVWEVYVNLFIITFWTFLYNLSNLTTYQTKIPTYYVPHGY